ncbi:BNR/Asp-box repeat-containing protein [Caballeronia arvi]|uniref:BNR/Asp-box repeat-containing protein n=1 Tax=Caballeronia arvi TaxID=1777135 RepID=A0A158KNS0_9BURK|nr:BNR/Asp-box repeat-containing protein [Caballeronia arvi]
MTESDITANKVAFVKSTDDGATWTKPQIIADLRTVGVTDPRDPNVLLRTGDIIPEPAIDPATGHLYVVWQDSRFSGGHFDEIVMSTSTDGGNTWSAPIRVNTPKGRAAFNPSIRVNSVGTVGVTYYDFRDLQTGNSSLLTGIWITKSSNGGQSFGGDKQRVAGPFDMKTDPNAEGLFVGDYQGLDVRGTTFLPFFVQTNPGPGLSNRTDVFFAPPPSP